MKLLKRLIKGIFLGILVAMAGTIFIDWWARSPSSLLDASVWFLIVLIVTCTHLILTKESGAPPKKGQDESDLPPS